MCNRWNPDMKTTHKKLVNPSSLSPPGFHTSPYPRARFSAYRMEIIWSSARVKYLTPSTTKLIRAIQRAPYSANDATSATKTGSTTPVVDGPASWDGLDGVMDTGRIKVLGCVE